MQLGDVNLGHQCLLYPADCCDFWLWGLLLYYPELALLDL